MANDRAADTPGGEPPASPSPLPPLTLEQSAALAGRYRWVEHRLFELTGSWAPSAPAPAAQVLLDALSLQHAWHAELWADRLPVLDGVDHDRLTRSPAALARLFEAMAEPDRLEPPAGEERWVARLAGLFRVVLPRLAVGYGRHLSMAVPATDGPTIRALRLILRDELEAWQAGEALLEELVTGPARAAAAAAAQHLLENLLVSGNSGPGLVPWPTSSDPAADDRPGPVSEPSDGTIT